MPGLYHRGLHLVLRGFYGSKSILFEIGCRDLPVDSIIWRSRMEKDFIDEFISSKDTRAYQHSIKNKGEDNYGYK